jgi:xyloglucan-specific exo-beta-1,4-glucanase
VTDSIATDSGWDKWGIDAVALDPSDPNKVYAAVGMYTNSWDPNNGAIVRSSDKGATWSSTTLSFKVGGNMPGRGYVQGAQGVVRSLPRRLTRK